MFHYGCLWVGKDQCGGWQCHKTPRIATKCHRVPRADENATYSHNTPPVAIFCHQAVPNSVGGSLRGGTSLKAEIERAAAKVSQNKNDGFDKPGGKWLTQTRNRLTAKREEKPRTKAGQIRALWPQIEAALADGQSISSIRDWLEEEGVVVSRATLSSYKKRFLRKEESRRKAQALEALVRQNGRRVQTLAGVQGELVEQSLDLGEANRERPQEYDPYAQARRALEDKPFDIRTVHGDGDPRGKNLV
jgi:hypothetical protein